ncbi:DNA-binding transcriptional regulator, FadR family [Tessaracoccus bendigoensis DSM 12906]|uniref:DNA-binding transcriptional regulator, FadR family n=2 Tax=Tessaracoccus TaxID=72763 RepID=A0A1M6AK44_9ACTN|nr:DNA-binding transcriptional regulator, FadR family [Tessaracoccus bendigoensis DSM 12906]
MRNNWPMTTGGFEPVLDFLTGEILDGRVGPGDRLPTERGLATQLGASRSAVREAIKVLQAQGVITSHTGPGGGTRVTAHQGPALGRMLKLHVALDAISFEEVTETRVVLERAAARAAAESCDDEAAAELEGMLEQMRVTLEADAYNRLDTAFHVAIAGLGANRLVRDVTVAIREAVARPILQAEQFLPEWEEFRRELNVEHEGILQALRAGDGNLAADRCEAHIRSAHHTLLP